MSHKILKIGDLDLDLQGQIGLQASKIFISLFLSMGAVGETLVFFANAEKALLG